MLFIRAYAEPAGGNGRNAPTSVQGRFYASGNRSRLGGSPRGRTANFNSPTRQTRQRGLRYQG